MVWIPNERRAEADDLVAAVMEAVRVRLATDPLPLGRVASVAELSAVIGDSITSVGLGGIETLRRFVEHIGPNMLTVDHPLYLAFIPDAPTHASVLADWLVSTWNPYPGTYADGSGPVYAENQALHWLAQLAGLPADAGGVFVSGGTAGNLSALLVARHRWRKRADGSLDRTHGIILTSEGAHSSVAQAAHVMDADVLAVPGDARGRLTRDALESAVERLTAVQRTRVFAVVATGGTTNAGIVDDLEASADVAAELATWLHVDAAYGGAAMASPTARPLFAGIERCDSYIVDPHKWLFAPFDACALLYRDPMEAHETHTQRAAYLDITQVRNEWNPADFAHHLTRRARGVPFWFSLVAYGTDAYRDAVQASLDLTVQTAELVRSSNHVELLMEPDLSIVMLRRPGWTADEYRQWSDRLLHEGIGYVTPTTWRGETVTRFCFVNPTTTLDDVRRLLATME
jgi:glutamate/tyrosine decarboxylase-like PLP-dependent enzyme